MINFVKGCNYKIHFRRTTIDYINTSFDFYEIRMANSKNKQFSTILFTELYNSMRMYAGFPKDLSNTTITCIDTNEVLIDNI